MLSFTYYLFFLKKPLDSLASQTRVNFKRGEQKGMPVTGTPESAGVGDRAASDNHHHLLAVTDILGFPSPCFCNHRSPSPTRDTYGCTI